MLFPFLSCVLPRRKREDERDDSEELEENGLIAE